MAIRIYNDGEHPAGFIGIRVARYVGTQYKQKYFNFRNRDKSFVTLEQERQYLKQARELDKTWQAQSEAIQYQKRVSNSHITSDPMNALGITGLTLVINRDRNRRLIKGRPIRPSDYIYFYAGFRVGNGLGRYKCNQVFKIDRWGYSDTWARAVECWAKRYHIQDEDKREVLLRCPDPDRFKLLRRHLNEKGWNIPVEVLHSVYAEQREALKAQRGLQDPKQDALYQQLQRERDRFERMQAVNQHSLTG